MKTTLILLFVVAGIAVAYAGLTCMTDKNKCEEDECCVKFGPVGRCRKLGVADERCEMHQLKQVIPNHMYTVMCPCAKGFKCVAKDGIIGKLFGTCQENSEEVATEAE